MLLISTIHLISLLTLPTYSMTNTIEYNYNYAEMVDISRGDSITKHSNKNDIMCMTCYEKTTIRDNLCALQAQKVAIIYQIRVLSQYENSFLVI